MPGTVPWRLAQAAIAPAGTVTGGDRTGGTWGGDGDRRVDTG
ncbi:MAG: hypothetical protein ACYCXN_15270 [Acidimicrobiales bacterium]